VVIWETTRSCALKCVHCRAEAIDRRSPDELTGKQAFMLLEEVRRFGKPIVVLTGGDPLRRPDIKRIVRYGTSLGLRMAVTPSGTQEITEPDVKDLKEAGTARLAVSVDGSSAGIHDAFRGVDGSFQWTMEILRWAKKADLPVQINTTISRHNIDDLDPLCLLMESMDIVLWSVFFLVPMGRAKLDDEIGGREYERVFNRMAHLAGHVSFDIKSTEAPHYRRVLIQRAIESRLPSFANEKPPSAPGVGRAPMGVNDGKGFVFISHTGEIYPSGFLPISGGNVKNDSLTDVYRHSELFTTIRDHSRLKGKCGACEYKTVCGGSRARAFAVHGDMMAADPFCVHVPRGYPLSEEERRYW
jgi:radical SAM protein